MRFQITHTTKYAYSEAVPVCQNKVHLRPRSLPYQTCELFRLMVMPEPAVIDRRTDFFGNSVEYFSLIDTHHGISITASSQVEVKPTPLGPVPNESPAWESVAKELKFISSPIAVADRLFSFDSDYASATSDLAEYAKLSFTPGRPILEASLDLMHRIHEEFQYNPQATNISTPLAEVFAKRAGVCQDFAHLQIACLRSLGLAAKYVSGYLRTIPPEGKPRLVGADESHAWLAVYCGQQGWIDLDPTNDKIPSIDHVTLAHGRDYGDVCPIQGVFVGGGDHTMTVSVNVEPI